MENPRSRNIAIALARHASDGMDSAAMAAMVVSTWKQIDATLRPILGPRGVASIYRRSLHHTTARYPWLAVLQDGPQATLDLPALEATLATQGNGEVAAASGDVFQGFYELLASLVGTSLTEQLLCSIWANSSRGQAAQDESR